MFTEADRQRLLERLVQTAREDPEIEAAALVGSYARREVDRWSDIDLALGLAEGTDLVDAAERWTGVIATLAAVADTLDLWAGPALYRVFLLQSSLQIDVSFWPKGTLAPADGQAFERLFGAVSEPSEKSPTDVRATAGWGWLYALHARSAIGRDRPWQALQMLEGLRDQVIVLCCARHGVETQQGRGVDRLPQPTRDALLATVPAGVEIRELSRSLTAALVLLHREVRLVDGDLAARLSGPLASTLR